MKYLGNGVMNRVERAFKELSRKIWQYIGDYKAVDDIEDSLNQLEESINELMAQNSDYIFPRVEIELERILDTCAANKSFSEEEYCVVYGAVSRIKEQFGE